jgi:molybdopterin synthase sulfur carrier subunit
MKIELQIPRVLQKYFNGNLEVFIEAETVGELLEKVQQNYPALYVCICDETGKLRQHINLFVNNDLLLERTTLDKRLNTGDVVSVFQAVSGG